MNWFDIKHLLPLIPALPLASAVLAIALGMLSPVTRRFAHVPVIVALLAACGASLVLFYDVQREVQSAPNEVYEQVISLWTWASVPAAMEQAGHATSFTIDVTLRADTLTCAMLAMVTFVASLVAIYAAGYMEDDEGFARFFAYVGLFVFSMTMLVSVSNFVLLFVFWEAVGLCSYLLIGFWFQKPEAADAGKKAFLVNRVGDFGFTLGIFLIWITYGTLNFHDTDKDALPVRSGETVAAANPGVLGTTRLLAAEAGKSGEAGGYFGGAVGVAICLLLLVGACGKSAQFPLHVWLPDAMEGPTPVSALIHAATMVTAGVYMITRCTPLFMVSPEAQLTVSIIGGITAIMAALIALTQFDLKRVLAYSTVSQLGYMFLALGAGTFGGITGGMFHLYTHAFFKALLFLGAGSVMHAMGGVIDMRRFSGLKDLMPWTCGTFLIGSLALSGVFPLAGFFSKDAVLGSVHDRAHDYQHAAAALAPDYQPDPHGHSGPIDLRLKSLKPEQLLWYGRIYNGLYWLGLFTAFLTAFYTFRAFFMTFFGEEKIPHEAGHHAHESPWTMVLPLVILAVCSCIVGFLLNNNFADYLGHAPSLGLGAIVASKPAPGVHADHTDVALLGTAAALLGIGIAAYFYLGHRREVQSLKSFFNLEWASRGDGRYLVSPYELSYHKFFLDEIYAVTIVWPLQILAAVSYWFDRNIVDGLVNLVGWIPGLAGSLLRSLQVGLVPYYALAMVLGLIVLAAARLLIAGS